MSFCSNSVLASHIAAPAAAASCCCILLLFLLLPAVIPAASCRTLGPRLAVVPGADVALLLERPGVSLLHRMAHWLWTLKKKLYILKIYISLIFKSSVTDRIPVERGPVSVPDPLPVLVQPFLLLCLRVVAMEWRSLLDHAQLVLVVHQDPVGDLVGGLPPVQCGLDRIEEYSIQYRSVTDELQTYRSNVALVRAASVIESVEAVDRGLAGDCLLHLLAQLNQAIIQGIHELDGQDPVLLPMANDRPVSVVPVKEGKRQELLYYY